MSDTVEQLKQCKTCKQDKPLSDYNKAGGGKWLQPYCKPCDSERKKRHYLENREKYKDAHKTYYELNKVAISDEQKAESRIRSNMALVQAGIAYNKAKKLPLEEKKKRKSENDRRYRERNAEKLKVKKNEYYKRVGLQRRKEWQAEMMKNPEFRLTKNLRGRIYVALKRGVKSAPTMELLGCSIEYFKEYIEGKFTKEMNWGNQGKYGWHIDHIIPCYNFDLTKEQDQKLCFHYSNMQPMWWDDNLKKGTKLNYKTERVCQK